MNGKASLLLRICSFIPGRALCPAGIAALAVAPLFAASHAQAQAGQTEDERGKQIIVERLFGATEAYDERCGKASPDAARRYEAAVASFVDRNSNLMKLVRQSVYYPTASVKAQVADEINSYRSSPEDVALECETLAALLNAFNNTPEGREAIQEWEELLSR